MHGFASPSTGAPEMRGAIGDARIRVPERIARGESVTVQAIILHPMDTGFARANEWQMIPAYFIQSVAVSYAGREIARFRWSSAMSKDPLITFQLKADREGPLTMTWTDNHGAVYQASADITFVS